MKSTLTLFVFLLSAFFLLNNSRGAGSTQNVDRTNSPLANGFCGNCHSAGAFAPNINISLLDNESVVESFEPGKTYQLVVKIEATDGVPDSYGFQAVALNDDKVNVGTFGMTPASMQTVNIGDATYVEHNQPSLDNTFTIDWTAPESMESITFYASGVAVNGNSSSGGDGAVFGKTTLEAVVSSVNDFTTAGLAIFPNPTSDFLMIQTTDSDIKIPTSYTIYNHIGQLVKQTNATNRITVSDLQAGLYYLQIQQEGQAYQEMFIKQ